MNSLYFEVTRMAACFGMCISALLFFDDRRLAPVGPPEVTVSTQLHIAPQPWYNTLRQEWGILQVFDFLNDNLLDDNTPLYCPLLR